MDVDGRSDPGDRCSPRLEVGLKDTAGCGFEWPVPVSAPPWLYYSPGTWTCRVLVQLRTLLFLPGVCLIVDHDQHHRPASQLHIFRVLILPSIPLCLVIHHRNRWHTFSSSSLCSPSPSLPSPPLSSPAGPPTSPSTSRHSHNASPTTSTSIMPPPTSTAPAHSRRTASAARRSVSHGTHSALPPGCTFPTS